MADFIHPQLNDKFAFALFGTGGFFIEAGAGDMGDATYALEKQHQWSGVLVEPIDFLCQQLKNMRSAVVDETLLWGIAGEQKVFLIPTQNPLFSSTPETLPIQKLEYFAGNVRVVSKTTDTLNNLVARHQITSIDYLCLDAEGSEYQILSTFDFDAVRPKLISSEDYYPHSLLLSNGYEQVENPFKPPEFTWEYYYLDRQFLSLLNSADFLSRAEL